jgi:hypothetical protein
MKKKRMALWVWLILGGLGGFTGIIRDVPRVPHTLTSILLTIALNLVLGLVGWGLPIGIIAMIAGHIRDAKERKKMIQDAMEESADAEAK